MHSDVNVLFRTQLFDEEFFCRFEDRDVAADASPGGWRVTKGTSVSTDAVRLRVVRDRSNDR